MVCNFKTKQHKWGPDVSMRHTPATHRPHTGHTPATHWPHTGHTPATHRPHTGHTPATHRPHTGHTPATHRPHTGHTPATHRPHTGHTPATHRPHMVTCDVDKATFFLNNIKYDQSLKEAVSNMKFVDTWTVRIIQFWHYYMWHCSV